jgi:hypothetical protein
MQLGLLGGLYVPTVHAVATLPPSHDDPAVQSRHTSRVVVVPPFVRLPAAHDAHVLEPVAAYFLSPPHGALTLSPAHAWPLGHVSQFVRVTFVPPDVNDPPAHVLQVPAPASEYLLSALHCEHAELDATLKWPATHRVMSLVPSHADPAGHCAHDVRVLSVLPEVYRPAAHVRHPFDLLSPVYLLSAPHGEQLFAPPAEYVPGVQAVRVLVPSHE